MMIPDSMIPLIRSQLAHITAASENGPIERERLLQDFTSGILDRFGGRSVIEQVLLSDHFTSVMAVPPGVSRDGILLYLHGGGYCCGDINYVRWVSRSMALQHQIPVVGPVYRLAPEHPYPAAVDDTEEAYRRLLENWPSDRILVAGESAGGGLAFSLCLRLKEKNLPLPAGIIAISPWTDLTQSAPSYLLNDGIDPSMTKNRLDKFALYYGFGSGADALRREPSQDAAPFSQAVLSRLKEPGLSPVYGDLAGLPPSLIFAGKDEVMLGDAQAMHSRLVKAGCFSRLTVAEAMWHAYILYGLALRRADLDQIDRFIRRLTAHEPLDET